MTTANKAGAATAVKRPASMFYWGDWRRDTALQSCSLAAKGLWIDMLALMHEGAPYGHLQVGAKDVSSPSALVRMVGGVSVREIATLLAELEEAGVFSRTASGTIYSRRMVRDENVRRVRAAGGGKSLDNPNVPRRKDPGEGTREGPTEGYPYPDPSPPPIDPSPAVAVAFAVAGKRSDDASHHPAGAAQDEAIGEVPHTRSSVLGLVVERLYFGQRPTEPEMATNASILERFHKQSRTWDELARIVEGLALRRDRGELRTVPPRQPVSLKWLNDADQLLNQSALCEDAYYSAGPREHDRQSGNWRDVLKRPSRSQQPMPAGAVAAALLGEGAQP